jgi:hypothetical protein
MCKENFEAERPVDVCGACGRNIYGFSPALRATMKRDLMVALEARGLPTEDADEWGDELMFGLEADEDEAARQVANVVSYVERGRTPAHWRAFVKAWFERRESSEGQVSP